MVRTQIYLTEDERSALRRIAERSGKPQSELIRRAVDEFIAWHDGSARQEVVESVAGMWRDRDDLPDFGSVRRTWDR